MQKLTDISEQVIKDYAKKHKVAPLEAYRDLLSQNMFEAIAQAEELKDLKEVLRELTKQVVGDGSKDSKILLN